MLNGGVAGVAVKFDMTNRLVQDILETMQPALDGIGKPGGQADSMSALAANLGVDQIGFLAVNLPRSNAPYLISTCGEAWTRQYMAQNYIDIDPIVAHGFSSLLPFDWADVRGSDPTVSAFFEDAATYGVKQHGLSFPVRGIYGETGVFSVNVDMSLSDWRRERKALARTAQIVALSLHARVVEGVLARPSQLARLTARETECMKWCSDGKTADETAAILNISERTVRSFLHSSRVKLGAVNTTQAVAEAIRLKLV